jgi:undecaprenyl-diphosphatase
MRLRRVSRRGVVVLAALLAAFGLVLLAVQTQWQPVHRLDNHVARSLYHYGRRHATATRFWRDVSRVLHPDVLRVAAAVGAAALWLRGRRTDAIFVVVAMAGQALLETTVKGGVDRARPSFGPPLSTAFGASFPSGHAMTAFVGFGVLVLVVPRSARAWVAAFAAGAVALVSFARLALAVHYVSDVAGAWLLGSAWLLLAYRLTRGVRVVRRAPGPPPGR